MYKLLHIPSGIFIAKYEHFKTAQAALNWFNDNNHRYGYERSDMMLFEYHLISQTKLA